MAKTLLELYQIIFGWYVYEIYGVEGYLIDCQRFGC